MSYEPDHDEPIVNELRAWIRRIPSLPEGDFDTWTKRELFYNRARVDLVFARMAVIRASAAMSMAERETA